MDNCISMLDEKNLDKMLRFCLEQIRKEIHALLIVKSDIESFTDQELKLYCCAYLPIFTYYNIRETKFLRKPNELATYLKPVIGSRQQCGFESEEVNKLARVKSRLQEIAP